MGAASASVNDGEWRRRRDERGAPVGTVGSGVKGVRWNAEPRGGFVRVFLGPSRGERRWEWGINWGINFFSLVSR